jgi:excisionase family DNA binding protein
METNSVMESTGAISPARTEWVRVPDAVRATGVGRSTLYALIKSGEIRSASIRKRNCVRGIRLINFDSLNAYIAKFAK